MRVRELIEHGPVSTGGFYLSTVDSNGDEIGGSSEYPTVEAAKADAEQSGNVKAWREPPKEWQPDAILVSNWYNDPGWDNR